MTERPPFSASGSGTVSAENHTETTSSNVRPISYGNHAWNNPWSSNYSGYATMTANPAMYAHMNPYMNAMAGYAPPPHMMPIQSNSYNPYAYLAAKTDRVQPASSTKVSRSPSTPPTSLGAPTPSLSELEGCLHWDDVLRRFLEKTKLTQCLKGFEIDMLVLNSEWEENVFPGAMKELVNDMQLILDRLMGVSKHAQVLPGVPDVNQEHRPLDERKIDHIRLRDGSKPQPPSSINKSISQFLARSRARNDASNRAEFLHSLAEKRRKIQDETTSPTFSEDGPTSSTSPTTEVKEIASCARVDAKPIDRDKQIKYDIAKNEAGPLTRSRVQDATDDLVNAPSTSACEPTSGSPMRIVTSPSQTLERSLSRPPKRARLTKSVDEDPAGVSTATGRVSSKGRGKAKDEPLTHSLSAHGELEEDGISEALLGGTEERVKNLEEHLSIRYVPSQPQTLLARLKYLEDHLIRLEKEYPPWGALHFNQPNRGWPPPPRATPVIVPPHLRKTEAADAHTTPPNSIAKAPQPGLQGASSATTTAKAKGKGRSKNSSLHKAVMDRLEIQNAMNEMEVDK